MELYFENSRGEERLIAECETVQGVYEWIHAFLDEHNFKSYYMRSWGSDDGITIDVGSHSEFFNIKGISYAKYLEGLQEL